MQIIAQKGVSNHGTETHATDYGVLCKANGATLHYVLASFVLFHSVRPLVNLR